MERKKSAIFCKINLDYLEEVTDASPTSMLEIIDVFLRVVPMELDRIRTLIEQQNTNELSVAIHKLGPKYHYVGITDLNETLVQIEKKIQEKELPACLDDLKEIEHTTNAAIKELHVVKEDLHRELQLLV